MNNITKVATHLPVGSATTGSACVQGAGGLGSCNPCVDRSRFCGFRVVTKLQFVVSLEGVNEAKDRV